MQEIIPVIGFVAAYILAKWTGHGEQALYWATAVLMLGTVLQLLWLHQRKKAISKQHWLTAIAILVLGSITLILKNPMFLKWKPTIVNLVFAAALLVSQWLGKTNIVQKMLGGVFTMPDALWRRLNLAWAIYLAFMAGLNLVIAYGFSDDFWVGFKLWGSGGCAILFFFAQAYVLRHYLNHEEKPQD